MKKFKNILLIGLLAMMFDGCYFDDDNNTKTPLVETNTTETNTTEDTNEEEIAGTDKTQFYADLLTVLEQNEDDEPLDVTDTLDETSNFNDLLK